MPEEAITSTDIQTTLQHLEEYDLDYPLVRVRNYKIMQNALEKNKNVSREELKRLLAVCVHDIPSMKYTTNVFNIIPAILSKVKAGSFDAPPDLVPSAVAVINLLKTIALLGKVESLMVLCLDTLLTYPEDTLIIIAENHCEDVIEIFNLCCNTRIQNCVKLQACKILHKLLKILPQGIKKRFVEIGVLVWFSKVIPTVMAHMTAQAPELYIEILELLTDDLIYVDYSDNASWHSILECICNVKRYPATMKNLLHATSDAWSRLWIVFIRLLKHQITTPLYAIGTPINSMLPVVEAAFKLDIISRCKAFECWSVLIDSFSTEVNENNINKRLKLLIIPLKSNNAKQEETAMAKFKCWWHLIEKFQNKMDKFLDIVLVSFLHFCFGKYNYGDKSGFIPGQFSVYLKKICNEALVEMVGHVNCNGCTELPRLKGKVINTKHLVDNWNHWIYSLTVVIMRTAKSDSGLNEQQMMCLWKSFLRTIGELPENNIRKDLFAEIISILAQLVQECKSNNDFLDITFNILILSLFNEDPKIKDLFKSDNSENDPIIRVVKIILDPSLDGYYNSLPTADLVTKLKPVAKLMLDESVCKHKHSIDWFISDLPTNDYCLLLWTALVQYMNESEYDSALPITCKIMSWPLKSINLFTKVQIPAMTWYTMFDLMYSKLNTSDINKDISEVLFSTSDVSSSTIYFKLCIVLAVLKHKFNENDCMSGEKEINLLLNLTKAVNSYEFYEPLMPILVDRIVAIMTVVITNMNETVAALILICVKNVLQVLTRACKQQSESKSAVTHIMIMVANLLKPLDTLFAVESYSKLIPAMTYHLLKCLPLLSKHSSTRNIILSIMKLILSKTKDTESNYKKIKEVISEIEDQEGSGTIDSNKFTTPQAKQVLKRTKKKEASIVNTVVENGEEYVVVKSNWKFNPRKLTENQKEKLQRKREDIPALYQDLSQSQDEFKLVSWKADSQDSTSSSKSESKSSKPENNETAADILKNLPSTNVVPQILETILSENEKQTTKTDDLQDNLRKTDFSTSNKTSKSPRMALKDRVFRNVRNLIEGSSLQKENKDSAEDKSKAIVNIKTPTTTKNLVANVVNSAPPLLSADRPSRVKRKPKKFDDLELLTSKKSRNSLPEIQPDGKFNDHEISLDSSQIVDPKNVDDALTAENDDKKSKNVGTDVDIHCKEHKVKGVAVENKNEIDETIVEKVTETQEVDMSSQFNPLECCNNIVPNNVTDIPIKKTFEDIPQISTPKSSKNFKQIVATTSDKLLTVNVLDNVTEVLSPKTAKTVKSESTPITTDIITQVDAANLTSEANVGKEISSTITTKRNKEVASPKVSADLQIKRDLTPKISKQLKEVSIPLTVATEVKEVSTSNTSEEINEVTPQSPTGFKEKSTSQLTENVTEKQSTDVLKEVEILLTPNQSKECKDLSTPKQSPKGEEQKTTSKKSTVKKSRIEKELAIDTVEGHPFLKVQTGKRLTRQALESASTGRRKSLAEKLNKSKSGGIGSLKNEKKTKERSKATENTSASLIVVNESQDGCPEQKEQLSFSEELPNSDDVIESSQDSTITTMSVKSTRKTPKKVPIVCVEKINDLLNKSIDVGNSQSILEHNVVDRNKSQSGNFESKDDTVLPLNQTVLEEINQDDLTENMDTQPVGERNTSEDVIVINDGHSVFTVSSEDPIIGPVTQEIAEADTQPTDPKDFMDIDDNVCDSSEISRKKVENHIPETCSEQNSGPPVNKDQLAIEKVIESNTGDNTADNITATLSESACADIEQASSASSPLKDEVQRQQDFLNNTIEISPIKTMSPELDKNSPSPETSSDYVVIKLSSPVNSNGEPFEKGGSPEVFTDDKVSPDKRDQSPPREEINVTNTSPSSSLSLKKNRPQVRSGGRAAQMLGLCVPDKVQAIVNPERNESEEVKKSTIGTSARRNLRILNNTVGENTDSSNSTSDNDDNDNFLKFKRLLPAVDSSPSGPILKRKLIEIIDDATISPASKRKRVSFHDPPVSTTVSVQKYIEPGVIRSPQNSAHKRLERQLRQHIPLRSPKRLDNVFKLDSVLTKTVESFAENDVIVIPDDSQAISLDVTPVAEVVRNSELNNTDPICPDLLGCKDSIENIAGELSSPAMKPLLIKELKGTIETIGDLAKLTELEVNRLCIKAPKVEVAKKVLTNYASKEMESLTVDEAAFAESMTEPQRSTYDIEMQTDKVECVDIKMQTEEISTRVVSEQTEALSTTHTSVQTHESGSRTTADIIKSCITEKPDFVEQLGEHLEESSISQLSEKLLLSTVTNLLMKKITPSETTVVLNRILESNANKDKNKQLIFIRDYLCDTFETKDLLLLCSQILKIVYDKPA